MSSPEIVKLVYDHDCPVCRFYSSRVELDGGRLELVNARKPGELLEEISAAGIDMDAGMALKIGDSLYYGSDAMHELAVRSSGKGLFNRLAMLMFRSPRLAKTLYPPLVSGRKLLLRMLGKTRINNLGNADRDRF